MKCLCCGKEIVKPSESEAACSWHAKCIKSFFGTAKIPQIELTEEQLLFLAKTTVRQGYTVQGVQKKMSLHLTKRPEARLTVVDYPNGYILKPQTEAYKSLPEYEHVTMLMAESCGIKTVPHALIQVSDQFAYITKRVDRHIGAKKTDQYAMEDFCQLSLRLTEDKYKGSYEQCGKIIQMYSVIPKLDMSELFLRLLFCFVTGNSDMHLKNFSLRERNSGKRNFMLAEAYDLLPVNIVNPRDKDETALALNGKKRNLRRKDFVILGKQLGVEDAAVNSMIRLMLRKKEKMFEICDHSILSKAQSEELKAFMESRMQRLI
ncbi:MAG: HipA domain-containing protein [Blautia sp.]|nr:HipA domain-containing protein [Blautia sp.]